MSHVVEINDLEQLAGYRLVWNSLLPQTPGVTFFQSFDWVTTYLRHFAAGQRLRVLIVYADDRPIGILPLVVRNRPSGIANVRVLTYPLDAWGSFFGPIGPNPTATLLAGMGHVRRTARDWDLIELPWVDMQGADRGRTRGAMQHAGFTTQVEPWQSVSLIDLAEQQNWDNYWASRTSRWRNNVRRSQKKLAEQGTVSYLRYRPAGAAYGDGEPRWDLYEACERIAQTSWQGDSQTGTTLSHAAIRPFLTDCHEAAARAGALDVNLLLVNGQPVAFNYAYQYNGHVFGLRTGFDRAFDGAGSVLQARMIEDSFSRGDREYDLGPDYEECKRYWRTGTRSSFRHTHFRAAAPIAQLVRAKRTLARLRGAVE